MSRYDLLVTMLLEYLNRQSLRYEGDIVQLQNNVSFRKADALDHLEMIMAQTRSATFDKFASDLHVILAISAGK